MARQGIGKPDSLVRRGSLADAHAILVGKLGANTPSLETLRAWRKRGLLDSAELAGVERSDKNIFRLFDLVRLCETLAKRVQVRGPRSRKAPVAPVVPEPLTVLPAPAKNAAEQLFRVAGQLEALQRQVSDLQLAVRERPRLAVQQDSASSEALLAAVSQLDAVRRMLQQRVDAEIALMRQNAPAPIAPTRTSPGNAPDALEFARLTQRVSVVEKAMKGLLGSD